MAAGVKPIVSIDIEDQKFKDFQKLFEKYQGQVKQTASNWRDTSKEANKFVGAMEGIGALLLAQTELLSKQKEDTREIAENVLGAEKGWRGISKSANTMASAVATTTRTLSRWLGLGSLVGSVFGVGGLFGLEALAGRAGAQRRSALGVGVTTAEQTAFGLSYGRYGDTDSVLGNVANARNDPSLGWIWGYAGITQQDLATKDNAGIAQQYLTAARRLYKQDNGNAAIAQSQGLFNIAPQELLRTLSAIPDQEWDSQAGKYTREVSELHRDDVTGARWSDLTQQLKEAGDVIENDLIINLQGLAGPLTQLTKTVTDAIEKLLSDHPDALPNLIKWVGDEVTKFAAIIDRWLGPSTAPTAGIGNPSSSDFRKGFQQQALSPAGKAAFVKGDKFNEIIYDMALRESSWDPGVTSPTGAMGLMQLLPGTAKDMGVASPYDPQQSIAGGTKYLEQLIEHFGGNLEEAEGGYAMGEGGLRKLIGQYGTDWRAHAPQETQDALNKLEKLLGYKLNSVKVVIENRTGSQPTVEVLSLAQ